ncbi:MAG: flagellar biosynthesis protein FlgL [Sulfurimonas sp.]|nr:flagellar biosynthesis protein FlgL [Sulfurimonas sp.]
MRVTQSMYYNDIFATNNSKLNKQLFDVNKQIASGLKIQYASDDVRTFTETMRLDNELATIAQTKKSIESGYKVSNQTDVTMNEFTDSMNRMRTLLVQASNDTNDSTSRDAISAELRGIEKNLISLANTSINGQFLFSGSAIDIKPIADDGTYKGNSFSMNAFLGSDNQQKYNITGSELFLGEETQVKRKITTNVAHSNLLGGGALRDSSSMRELMGDKNSVSPNTPVFYLRGTRSDGTSFKEKIDTLSDTDSISDLLAKIENIYGNNTVNVSLNDSGQIVIEDKLKGSSKLDFHMVGAIDYTDGTAGFADVGDIDTLDIAGETIYPPTGELYIKEFSKSDLVSPTTIEGLTYDRNDFMQKGSTLSSNVPQVIKGYNKTVIPFGELNKNAFATDSTKLSDVADAKEMIPATTPKTYSLDGVQLISKGTDINGNVVDLQIDLKDAGSTFSLNGSAPYNIYNVDGTQANANDMTYKQLMDVINMAQTTTLPITPASPDPVKDYQDATKASTFLGNTSLTYDGKIQFEDINNAKTKATMSLYDTNSNDFSIGADASVMTFNTNNALTVRDPKTDFFKEIDEIIKAVENYNNNPDSSSPDIRNVGIQNAITMMDDLQDHTFRTQSVAGSQSNTLSDSLERAGILEISTMSLRSSVIDTDLAESSLRLSQLTLNYQAMLSTVGKVSQLSLVNYL